jgi:Animal haem peroxidase
LNSNQVLGGKQTLNADQSFSAKHTSGGKHSDPIRGLTTAVSSPLFEGRFGRMFRSLPAAIFGSTDRENELHLQKLGHAMSNTPDAPKDGPDDEESGTPALYTYFAQFIDHDLTFDPASSLQKQDDPNALFDYRTPALDLDNVYGRGPDDQPYMYDNAGRNFLLGDPIHGGDRGAHDLQRNHANPRRALIGDPRNDENAIVSQLQGLVHRFHNRVASENPQLTFPQVQQFVRFHYQYLVLNDFLPRIVHSSVINDLKSQNKYDPGKLKFYHPKNHPFMPVEFSVAAYRLGHSMIRPGYRLNDEILRPIFPVRPKFPEGLTGFRAMHPAWGIDWGRLIDIDRRDYTGPLAIRRKRLQFAYRIDTSLVFPLSHLPPAVAAKPMSLAGRNLLRGYRLGLPTGQDVARLMGVDPLPDNKILIGTGVDDLTKPNGNILGVSRIFANNCPLWTYILAEAMHYKEAVTIPVKESISITTPRLGPVGGRIVAEVFLGLLADDSDSYLGLYPSWQPPSGPGYALKDFVKYALGR